jgi:hypothetical protein
MPHGDDLIYERIAIHPFAVHTFPFGYRIGPTWLMHVLPLGTTAGLHPRAWVAAGGTAAFASADARAQSRPARRRGLLDPDVCLAAVSTVVIRQGRNPDIAAVFFMMAATHFVVRRDLWKLAGTLLVGVVFREAVLFIVPLPTRSGPRSSRTETPSLNAPP